jgi:hypothetical protein
VGDLRAALLSDQVELDLACLFDRLMPVDLSQDLLARQTDQLRVLRLLRCGWWPLKSPRPNRSLHNA